jgi:hypothetical protein
MRKKSLIIQMVVLLAAAGLLFGIAGHLVESQGNQPGKRRMMPISTAAGVLGFWHGSYREGWRTIRR